MVLGLKWPVCACSCLSRSGVITVFNKASFASLKFQRKTTKTGKWSRFKPFSFVFRNIFSHNCWMSKLSADSLKRKLWFALSCPAYALYEQVLVFCFGMGNYTVLFCFQNKPWRLCPDLLFSYRHSSTNTTAPPMYSLQ